MPPHCNACLWPFKWFIFIDCFCLVAGQKIMVPGRKATIIAKEIAMQFGRLVMECVTRKWVVMWARPGHPSPPWAGGRVWTGPHCAQTTWLMLTSLLDHSFSSWSFTELINFNNTRGSRSDSRPPSVGITHSHRTEGLILAAINVANCAERNISTNVGHEIAHPQLEIDVIKVKSGKSAGPAVGMGPGGSLYMTKDEVLERCCGSHDLVVSNVPIARQFSFVCFSSV